MFRHVLIVVAAAVFAALGFALIIGLWWLVSVMVSGTFPRLVQARLEANFAVLVTLMMVAAWVGGGLAAARMPRLGRRQGRKAYKIPPLHFRH